MFRVIGTIEDSDELRENKTQRSEMTDLRRSLGRRAQRTTTQECDLSSDQRPTHASARIGIGGDERESAFVFKELLPVQ